MDAGDNSVPVIDDGSSGEINLSTAFPFFGKFYTSLWLSLFIWNKHYKLDLYKYVFS